MGGFGFGFGWMGFSINFLIANDRYLQKILLYTEGGFILQARFAHENGKGKVWRHHVYDITDLVRINKSHTVQAIACIPSLINAYLSVT